MNKLNWHPDTAYFNACVLLFNLKKWRTEKIDDKWKAIAASHSNDLISKDQTLLNAVCEGEFEQLPKEYNVNWLPGKAQPPGNYPLFGFTQTLGFIW